jgi:hypothetical protein
MLSVDYVVRSRQAEIVKEVQSIEDEIRLAYQKIEELKQLRDLRIAEHDILDKADDRGIIIGLGQTTKRSSLAFEDCIKRIFDNAGKPLRMKELIEELEKFNYIWSNYANAYNHITKSGHVQAVIRGYYQLVK